MGIKKKYCKAVKRNEEESKKIKKYIYTPSQRITYYYMYVYLYASIYTCTLNGRNGWEWKCFYKTSAIFLLDFYLFIQLETKAIKKIVFQTWRSCVGVCVPFLLNAWCIF